MAKQENQSQNYYKKTIQIKNKFPILFNLVIAGFLIFIFTNGIGWLMGPSVNKKPTQRIVVYGKFPYEKHFHLEMKVSFHSTNPICKQTARAFIFFPQAEVNRKIRIPLNIKKINQDSYISELYLDNFSPGICNWTYGGVAYRISGPGQMDDAMIGLGPISTKENRVNMECQLRKVRYSNLTYVGCMKSATLDGNLKTSAEINFFWKNN